MNRAKLRKAVAALGMTPIDVVKTVTADPKSIAYVRNPRTRQIIIERTCRAQRAA